jgi:heptosyltransferase II
MIASGINSFLIIQTAFIGDVILATALIEKIRETYPSAKIDFLLRKGNEGLLSGNPHLREVIIWDKKQGKIKNLLKIISCVRSKRYDCVINAHRFSSSGLITALSGASQKIGFDKNPLSFLFTKAIKHDLNSNLHEVERNQKLIESITDSKKSLPKLYPSKIDFEKVKQFQIGSYICIAPTSVWFTKQFPPSQWILLLKELKSKVEHIYLLGAPADQPLCDAIKTESENNAVITLAGKLSFLESAVLMKGAKMNYVNDSAPLHMTSSMNARVTAVFCSTVPSFGFGPLSDKSFIIETKEKLDCRPCGLHGYKSCPKTHFKCATTIATSELLAVLNK